jgi:methylmalonyl-CoA/ethylmalonyl-CoA epimerase
MVIDHVGIVVRSLEEGLTRWEELFEYRQCSSIVTNTRQMVRVVFVAKEGSLTIKLIEPSTDQSPVSAFARRGGGLHHICFRCDDLDTQIQMLKHAGARLVVPPQPGEAFNNKEIAFLLVEPALNIELIATTDKAGWITQVKRS